MTYYVYRISEDGDVSFNAYTEAQVLRLLEESGPPCEGHLPDMDGGSGNHRPGPCWVIIKGEVVTPMPEKVVERWRL